MKKLLNYYLPIAAYCAVFIFLILSMSFVKRTPETEKAIIEYEPAIFNFIAHWVLLPSLGFAYFKYFFETLFYKINAFLFKRYAEKYESHMTKNTMEYKIKKTNENIVSINGGVFILIFIISLCV